MRILVFGVCRCEHPAELRALQHWAAALDRVAPDADHLIVDTKVPAVDPARLPGLSRYQPAVQVAGEIAPVAIGRRSVLAFPDDIGTLEQRGGDGWGRAFCQGLLCAVANRYDVVVHVEAGLLTRLDIPHHCRAMRERGIDALGAITPNKGWLESGLMFFDAPYVERIRLVDRYRWDERGTQVRPQVKMSEILGDALYLRPWRGVRDNVGLLRFMVKDLHWLKSAVATECDAFLWHGEWPVRRFGDPVSEVLAESGR
jgi:hypothetical protein